jgi:hypothetical protein
MADEQKPAAEAAEKPAEKPADKPAEKPAEKPADQSAEKPAADAKPAAEEKPKADAEAPPEPKAPDKYVLKIPDAGAAYVDPADLAHLEKVARAANWSNEDAQAALEEHIATIAAQSERFAAETKADRTYGGEHLADSQRLANFAINKLRPEGHERRDAFMRFLNRGGAGNHLEVIAFLADLGRMMGEDSPAHAMSSQAGTGEGLVEKLYDHPDSIAMRKRAS